MRQGWCYSLQVSYYNTYVIPDFAVPSYHITHDTLLAIARGHRFYSFVESPRRLITISFKYQYLHLYYIDVGTCDVAKRGGEALRNRNLRNRTFDQRAENTHRQHTILTFHCYRSHLLGLENSTPTLQHSAVIHWHWPSND